MVGGATGSAHNVHDRETTNMRIFFEITFSKLKSILAACALLPAFTSFGIAQTTLNPERRSVPDRLVAFSKGSSGINIDVRRSIFVTEKAVVSHISFEDVMTKLAGNKTKAIELYKAWFSAAGNKPELNPVEGIEYCDKDGVWNENTESPDGPDVPSSSPNRKFSMFNGYPFHCPRQRTMRLSDDNPFPSNIDADEGYTTVAAINRFDLNDAQTGATNCGEYRLIFARNSGKRDKSKRILIIFEANLPNPDMTKGIAGCKPVQDMWLSLTGLEGPGKRGKLLKSFFLDGLPADGVEAPIKPSNLGLSASMAGQVRTNQFMQSNWTLREFKFKNTNAGLRLVRSPVAGSPFAQLFAAKAGDPLEQTAKEFADEIVAQLGDLTKDSIDTFSFPTLSIGLTMGESDVTDPFLSQYSGDGVGNGAFDPDGIVGKRLSSTILPGGLTPKNIVRRIQVFSCAGCHSWSSNDGELGFTASDGGVVKWPRSLDFTHVSEKDSDPCQDVESFKISQTLSGLPGSDQKNPCTKPVEGALLTYRKGIMEEFLAEN